jgi:acetolactate synthase-1/2/3 large subunit
MNGAESLLQTLVNAGVGLCFANPGTSEMHFVAALDRSARHALRAGAVRGRGHRRMADGYYRMAGTPAATLLHLGPGLGNGLANLHNARKGVRASSTSSATTPPTTSSTTRRWHPTSSGSPARCRDGCTARAAPGSWRPMAPVRCRLPGSCRARSPR